MTEYVSIKYCNFFPFFRISDKLNFMLFKDTINVFVNVNEMVIQSTSTVSDSDLDFGAA